MTASAESTSYKIKQIISWVDDLILAADPMDSVNNIKRMLMSEFKMKNLGKFLHFLDINFNITQELMQMSQ